MEEISKWFLIMNYGNYYKEVSFNKQSINIVRKAISQDLKFTKGELHSSQRSTRSSEVAWVRDMDLLSMLMRMSNRLIDPLTGT